MIETMLLSRLREYGIELESYVIRTNPADFTEVLSVRAVGLSPVEIAVCRFELRDSGKLADKLTYILLERWTQ